MKIKSAQTQSRWLKEEIIFSTHLTFEEKALLVFQYQAAHNPIYAAYLSHLKRAPKQIKNLIEIPFLPIVFFKNHVIQTGQRPTELIFQSSGTTEQVRSCHYVSDSAWYRQVAVRGFEQYYGKLENYIIFALLPSYIEQGNSSLVYMIAHFIAQTQHPLSGFYLRNTEELLAHWAMAAQTERKVIVWGVTFALLDMIEKHHFEPYSEAIVIETGGMKGRREEMVREALHARLQQAFQVQHIHSEYGMTELLSQAYSLGNGVFYASDTMKILLRDINDPFEISTFEQTQRKRGGINVVDLANVDSCAFIETQDIGVFAGNGGFQVIGRTDHAELRGCSLLTAW